MSMNGLLDGNWSPDADRNDSINQGLLAMGLNLMSSKGRFGDALGQAGLAGMDRQRSVYTGLQNDRVRQLQMQQAKMQLDEQQAKAEQQKRTQEFIRQLASPQMQASQAGMMGGGGPTQANAAAMPPVDPQQQQLLDAVRAGAMSYPDYLSSTRKDTSPIKMGPGDSLVAPQTFKVLASNPKEGTVDPFIRFMKESGIDPMSPQGQQLIRAKMQKDTTHQPPVSVSYGAPVAGVDIATGNQVYFQPDKKGGEASIIRGIRPPDHAPKDLTESQAKATVFLGQMESASVELKRIGGDRSSLGTQLGVAMAAGPANMMVGQQGQQLRQAQDQWSEAYLRFKTGAATNRDEIIRNNATYFPLQGDKPDVIAQKARMRKQAERDLGMASGRGEQKLHDRATPPPTAASSGWSMEEVR